MQIRALFNKKHKAKPPPRTNISHVIMPATSLLDRIDVERKMTAVECLELIQEDVTKFNDMLDNPAMFSEINPYWDAEDYIGLHESFYLLEPMEEKWGKWVSWKCMCESFFSNGICGHSLLMTLLYDSSLEFPTQWSSQQLPSNAKSKKRPSAWAEFHVEDERPARNERWAPTLLGEEDLIITKSLKVLGNFIHFPWPCLIHASLAGAWR